VSSQEVPQTLASSANSAHSAPGTSSQSLAQKLNGDDAVHRYEVEARRSRVCLVDRRGRRTVRFACIAGREWFTVLACCREEGSGPRCRHLIRAPRNPHLRRKRPHFVLWTRAEVLRRFRDLANALNKLSHSDCPPACVEEPGESADRQTTGGGVTTAAAGQSEGRE